MRDTGENMARRGSDTVRQQPMPSSLPGQHDRYHRHGYLMDDTGENMARRGSDTVRQQPMPSSLGQHDRYRANSILMRQIS